MTEARRCVLHCTRCGTAYTCTQKHTQMRTRITRYVSRSRHNFPQNIDRRFLPYKTVNLFPDCVLGKCRVQPEPVTRSLTHFDTGDRRRLLFSLLA
ncbi:hypothetical protein EVAR_38025_1 [Eumeta japonica]|uniref:Uncharacterized protein n=1 Tax=Eumeta variegata TaxID=151549 RepID=A0A4C1W874_EUMVA|nr:hypothetical protein EVAR_38025_1 [Eumeta japonica]